MSDPNSSDPVTDRDADRDRSSGEEQLEREAELQQDEERKREEGPSGSAEGRRDPETPEEAAAEDAEEVEGEWHVWILGLLVVAGIALFFAPRFFLPELLGSLGVFLVLIGVLGWLVTVAIGRSA